ncbi:MAG: asparagine synthase [Phycisphaera sp. RhM]|nr:asparagine synthase [Phycisphaera sp. RhM]
MDALVGFTGPPSETLLRSMIATLMHRGKAPGEVFLQSSHASLARLQLSDDHAVGLRLDRREVVDDDVTLLVCGFLTRGGNESAGGSVALSGLIAEYRARGIAALSRLQGAAIVAIADETAGALHVARIGAGVRTVFYGRYNDMSAVTSRWLVASEPKAITSAPGFAAEIRPAAIAQYLAFSFVPGHGTMLKDVYELPAGHAVTLGRDATSELTNLFPFEEDEWDGRGDGDDHRHWVAESRRVISDAVARRLPSGEPVGIFLSGGLDSSIVAAEVVRQHSDRVLTYAIHFGKHYPNELEFARSVADRLGTEHHEVMVNPRQFAPRLRQMIWHLDDPIGDPITQPNFELARRVSQDVRYVFNGEGGDPLFGGPKNLPMMMQHWYGVPREPGFREKAYLASYRRAYEEWSRVLHPRIRDQIDPERDLESILAPFFQQSSVRSFLNKLMAINIRLKGAHLILPKVERMLAASGLTPLAPLFDEELIRLSFQMPPRMKLRSGDEKWVLKRAYEDDLPREVIARPKSGMRVPVHYWFRGEMRRLAKKTLASRHAREAEWFDPDRIRQLLRYDIEEGAGRYGMRLWMLMTFELWRRVVVDRDLTGVSLKTP